MLVSVLIPTYNRVRYLPEALASVLAQTCADLECIVVDDGSTDGTEAAVRPSLADPRVRYVRQENRGAAAARNRGIALSRGRYVTFLDSDDLWEPGKLAIQTAVLDALPYVGIVCSDFSAVYPDGRTDASHLRAYFSVLDEYGLSWDDVFEHKERGIPGAGDRPVHWGNVYETELFGNVVLTSTVMVRREILVELGGFDERFVNLEDYDLFLRITKRHPAAYVDRPLVRYRYSEHQLSGEEYFGKLSENLIRIFQEQVANIEGTEFLRKNRRRIRRRLGEYQARRAYFLFSQDKMPEAAGAWRASLRYCPAEIRSWIYLTFSLLPAGVTRMIRRAKSRRLEA